jgi:hypothetical protein
MTVPELEQYKTNGPTSDLLVGEDQHDLALVNEDIALHRRGIRPSNNAELFSSRKHTTRYVDTTEQQPDEAVALLDI